jgi:hypothetical protein
MRFDVATAAVAVAAAAAGVDIGRIPGWRKREQGERDESLICALAAGMRCEWLGTGVVMRIEGRGSFIFIASGRGDAATHWSSRAANGDRQYIL